MTLTDAQMNFPWEGVILLGRNPKNPADVLICTHARTGWVMMDDSIKEYNYKELLEQKDHGELDTTTPRNVSGIVKEKKIPSPWTNKKSGIARLVEIENFDWSPCRSFVPGEYT